MWSGQEWVRLPTITCQSQPQSRHMFTLAPMHATLGALLALRAARGGMLPQVLLLALWLVPHWVRALRP
jgi:hypothetical protein